MRKVLKWKEWEYTQYDQTYSKKSVASGGKVPRRKLLTKAARKMAAAKGGKGKKNVPSTGVKKPQIQAWNSGTL